MPLMFFEELSCSGYGEVVGSKKGGQDPKEALGIVHGRGDYSLDHGGGHERGEKRIDLGYISEQEGLRVASRLEYMGEWGGRNHSDVHVFVLSKCIVGGVVY